MPNIANPQVESHAPRGGVQVVDFLIGPAAWGLDLLISYALVPHACSTGRFYVLHISSLVWLAAALTGAWLAWRRYSDVRGGNDEGGRVIDRAHFLALLALLSNLWFAVVIIAGAVPRWILSPCD